MGKKINMHVLTRNDNLMPTISPFYDANPSVHAVLQMFSEKETVSIYSHTTILVL
jgi:hypothetical protein